MRVSVLLLLYQSRPFIEGCLRTLEPALAGLGAEAVLVDPGSGDGAAEWARVFLGDRGVPHSILEPRRNLGVAGGRNAAARARRYHLRDFDFGSPRPVPWMAGACQLMQREVFLALGGFDDSYFYGLEETDHCLRTWLAGREVWFAPAGPVYHHTQRLSSRSLRFLLLHTRSALRFFVSNRRRIRAAETLYQETLARALRQSS